MTVTPPGTGPEVQMDFETALSVDAVEEAARELAGEGPSREDLEALVEGEPAIDIVFEILADLQRRDGKTIVMVEQNAKKGLEFADIGYVLVSGRLAMAGPGDTLLEDPEVGRLFLGA